MTFQSAITTPALRLIRQDLRRITPILRHAIDHNTSIPVLETLRITARPGDDTARVLATDLDIEVEAHVPAICGRPLDACLPARVAFALAADGGDTIDIWQDGEALHIGTDDMTGRLGSPLPPEDFPMTTQRAPISSATLSEAALHRLLRLTAHCVSTEETRYYLNGVFFTAHPDKGTIRAVATDGHRMAVIDDDTPRPEDWPDMIVPRRTAAILRAMTGAGGNTEVTLTAQANALQIARDDLTVTTKLIDGTYPKYMNVVPEGELWNNAALNRTGVTRLHRAAQALQKRSGKSRRYNTNIAAAIKPGDGRIVLRGPDMEISGPVTAHAESPIAFNAQYLVEQLRITPTIRLYWQGEGLNPAIVEAIDDLEHPARGAFWILMPMRE